MVVNCVNPHSVWGSTVKLETTPKSFVARQFTKKYKIGREGIVGVVFWTCAKDRLVKIPTLEFWKPTNVREFFKSVSCLAYRVKKGFLGFSSVTTIQKSVMCFLLQFLFCHLHAQQIRGVIQDSNANPVPFANILLLNPTDSALIKGAISDQNGQYNFEHVPSGIFVLSGYLIGYQKVYLPIDVAGNQMEAPLIRLVEEIRGLDEVVVEATRPLIEQDNFRTLINVANSIIATGSTALEILEKAPGVSVDPQGNGISLMGRDRVIVQINGKQTYLPIADVISLLRSMPSDNIDQIELISSPSAKYDAEGNSGIINLIMGKNENAGTNGSMTIGGGSGFYQRGNGSIQLNHRNKKINLFGNYSANLGGFYNDFKLYREQTDGEEWNLVNQDSFIKVLNRGQNAKAGIDYFLTNRTTIGLVWNGIWANVDEDSPAYTSFRRQAAGPVYLQQLSYKTLLANTSNHLTNLNVQHKFGSNEATLVADLDIGVFSRGSINDLTILTLIPADPAIEVLLTEMPTQIDILTFKFDYSRVIHDKWKLETGFKYSNVQSDNDMSLSRGPQDNVQVDPLLSNHFHYSEKIHAAYLSLSGPLFPETDVQLGLRAEHTESIGQSFNLGEKNPREYLRFFPTLFLSKNIAEKQKLSFSYGYRLDRPNYQDMNPGRYYVDPYVYRIGNPSLKPQYSHTFEVKHTFHDKVFTSLGANYINDYLFWILQPADNRTAERTIKNFGDSQLFNLSMSFPFSPIKNWNMQTTLLGVYGRFQYEFLGLPEEPKQISGRINIVNSILLGKGWTGEMTGWTSTPSQQFFIRLPWLGSLDLGLQKSLGDNWKAKLVLQDLFHTNRSIGSQVTPLFVQNYHIRKDTRLFLLNLNYTFGNQKLKSARQRKTGAEQEIQRAN